MTHLFSLSPRSVAVVADRDRYITDRELDMSSAELPVDPAE
jgi:hypothetical protein